MCLFSKIKKHNDENRNKVCDGFVSRLLYANSEADFLLQNDYLEAAVVNEWNDKYRPLCNEIGNYGRHNLKRAINYDKLNEQIRLFNQNSFMIFHRIGTQSIPKKDEINKAYKLIGTVEGRKLDTQQMACIIKEAHNHLIIAGAGTGKTTTVVGKIKYLLKSGKCNPDDILVLSFTNTSASEMSQRINKETGCNITASTFHKLGLSIITKADGIKPIITQINLKSFIKDKMSNLITDKGYLRNLSNYLLYNKVPYKSEFEFTNEQEYYDYLELNPPETFIGEKVKSYGEVDIANWLYQNGIKYQYEASYQFDTRTEQFSQYHPDFFLTDYDIYIEFFGINRAGEVPSYFSEKNGKSATEAYRESMEWKFNLHKENKTKMIACYSYEKAEGILFDNLQENLNKFDVEFSPKSSDDLWRDIEDNNKDVLEGIIELFETVINLLKSNNYTIDYFKSIADCRQHQLFISLIEPIFNAYNKELANKGEIDFNDMINRAAEYIRTGKVQNHFSYVIVDEYQDISKSRYTLLAELRKSHDFDLFCVGDDWQSIYRFAGSDINYILNFQSYWGKSAISKIETTYRFTNSLIEISGSFITQNPKQIIKNIKGNSSDNRFSLGEVSGYNDKYSVEFMAQRIDELPQNSSVFFIGRYSFDVNLLKESGLFDCQYNNVTGFIDVSYQKRPDLKMYFLTAHKSKGLQADYVFIINNKNSRTGFPSKIQDDPILNLLLDNSETFPYSEERRLYYVALTRAKIKTFFLVVKDKESAFAKELHNRYEKELKRERFSCPLCGGRLQLKTGPYGDFYGCENYKRTGCKYKRKVQNTSAEKGMIPEIH